MQMHTYVTGQCITFTELTSRSKPLRMCCMQNFTRFIEFLRLQRVLNRAFFTGSLVIFSTCFLFQRRRHVYHQYVIFFHALSCGCSSGGRTSILLLEGKVAGSIPLVCMSEWPWATYWTLGQHTEPWTAPDVMVGTLHGSHHHECRRELKCTVCSFGQKHLQTVVLLYVLFFQMDISGHMSGN